jgi:hypothetical protein
MFTITSGSHSPQRNPQENMPMIFSHLERRQFTCPLLLIVYVAIFLVPAHLALAELDQARKQDAIRAGLVEVLWTGTMSELVWKLDKEPRVAKVSADRLYGFCFLFWASTQYPSPKASGVSPSMESHLALSYFELKKAGLLTDELIHDPLSIDSKSSSRTTAVETFWGRDVLDEELVSNTEAYRHAAFQFNEWIRSMKIIKFK